MITLWYSISWLEPPSLNFKTCHISWWVHFNTRYSSVRLLWYKLTPHTPQYSFMYKTLLKRNKIYLDMRQVGQAELLISSSQYCIDLNSQLQYRPHTTYPEHRNRFWRLKRFLAVLILSHTVKTYNRERVLGINVFCHDVSPLSPTMWYHNPFTSLPNKLG